MTIKNNPEYLNNKISKHMNKNFLITILLKNTEEI